MIQLWITWRNRKKTSVRKKTRYRIKLQSGRCKVRWARKMGPKARPAKVKVKMKRRHRRRSHWFLKRMNRCGLLICRTIFLQIKKSFSTWWGAFRSLAYNRSSTLRRTISTPALGWTRSTTSTIWCSKSMVRPQTRHAWRYSTFCSRIHRRCLK